MRVGETDCRRPHEVDDAGFASSTGNGRPRPPAGGPEQAQGATKLTWHGESPTSAAGGRSLSSPRSPRRRPTRVGMRRRHASLTVLTDPAAPAAQPSRYAQPSRRARGQARQLIVVRRGLPVIAVCRFWRFRQATGQCAFASHFSVSSRAGIAPSRSKTTRACSRGFAASCALPRVTKQRPWPSRACATP